MTQESPQTKSNTLPGFSSGDLEGMLSYGLGLGNPSGIQDPLNDAVRGAVSAGVHKVAEGLVSTDPNERANAVRATLALIAIASPHSVGSEIPTDTEENTDGFGSTTFSPEEIQLGLTQVATTLPGQTGGLVRESLSLPHPQSDVNQEEEQPSLFDQEEAIVAGAMVLVGMSIANSAEQGGKLAKPDLVWSAQNMATLEQALTIEGSIKGDADHIKAVVERTRAKFYASLQEAIRSNQTAQRQASKEAARL